VLGKIAKSTKSGGGYIWLSLTDAETKKELNELLESNAAEFVKCYDKACDIAETIKARENTAVIMRTALALFDKQATASFTMLQNALDKKNHDRHLIEPAAKEMVKEAPKQAVKSELDTAFKKASEVKKPDYTCPRCHVEYRNEEAVTNHICPAEAG